MSSGVLLMSDNSGFMTQSILRSFKDNHFEAEYVEPNIPTLISKLASARGSVFMIVMYTGDYVEKDTELLIMVKEICESEKMKLCLVGYRREMEIVKQTIPPKLISCEIERPFSMDNFINDIMNSLSSSSSAEKKRSILLVDDDPSFLMMMTKWLSGSYDVTALRTGTTAVLHLTVNPPPELVLLDYDMPDLSGPDVMTEIRAGEKCPNVPIIFLTGKCDKESVMKVMELRPQGYILKSGTQEEILRSIDDFFAKHKPSGNSDDMPV